jgi:hypothetical protein
MTESPKFKSWLLGKLGDHTRGQTLSDTLGCAKTNEPPKDDGVCLVFASDFQSGDDSFRGACLNWCLRPGRTLVLVPPMKLEDCKVPMAWRPLAAGTIDASKSKGLAKLLAPELKYEMTTDMQPAKLVDGEWNRGGINTAYYKKHPNSGVFAVTCLPLWSLSVLDHGKQLITWIQELHSLSGDSIPEEENVEGEPGFEPTHEHFALMLHLTSGTWKSRESALRGLEDSVVLTLPAERADECLKELEENGLAVDGGLSDRGKDLLRSSPYAAYAGTLEKLK